MAVNDPDLAAYYPELDKNWNAQEAREALQEESFVTGSAVGFAGSPGHFFVLAKGFLKYPDKDLFLDMLESPIPVERVMGTLGLTLAFPGQDVQIQHHYDDPEEVHYAPFGCSILIQPVGEVIKALHENPEALGVLQTGEN